jgi:hypothetical protein
MATNSSAKKVARVAAKSGSGRPTGTAPDKQRNWLFAAAVVAIVALGIGIVAFARVENEGAGDNTTSPKANLQDGNPFDHWHAAFAVNVCGTEVSPLQDGVTDPLGIHTHGDGLIHIHPFTRSAAGDRATMSKYFGQVDFKVTDEGFQLPGGTTTEDGGTTVKEGETTCGGEPGELVLAHWADAVTAASSEPDEIIRSDFGSVRFAEDGGAFTLAFVAEGSTDIPAPSTAAEIETLGAIDEGTTPPDTETPTETSIADTSTEPTEPAAETSETDTTEAPATDEGSSE